MQKVELSYSELGFLVYACRSLKDYYKFLNANFPDKVSDQMLTELFVLGVDRLVYDSL